MESSFSNLKIYEDKHEEISKEFWLKIDELKKPLGEILEESKKKKKDNTIIFI